MPRLDSCGCVLCFADVHRVPESWNSCLFVQLQRYRPNKSFLSQPFTCVTPVFICTSADLPSLLHSISLESVLKILTSSGLMNCMNPQHIFVTVHDAVMYIQQQKVKKKKTPPEQEQRASIQMCSFPLSFTRVMCRRRNLQRTPPPSGYESCSHHRHLRVPGTEMPEGERSFPSLIAEDTCL